MIISSNYSAKHTLSNKIKNEVNWLKIERDRNSKSLNLTIFKLKTFENQKKALSENDFQ